MYPWFRLMTLVVLAVAVLSGCKLEGEHRTKINPDGTVDLTIELGADRNLGGGVWSMEPLIARAREAHWTVDQTLAGGRQRVQLSRRGVAPEALATEWDHLRTQLPPALGEAPSAPLVRREDSLFATVTHYELTLPPQRATKPDLADPQGLASAVLNTVRNGVAALAVSSVADVQIAAELPGQIEETNADHREGSKVSWIVTAERLRQGGTFRATSRLIRRERIALAAGLPVGLLFCGLVLFSGKRRRA